jgi:DNA-binding transcriptional regulator YdaS (Cro superfamily)
MATTAKNSTTAKKSVAKKSVAKKSATKVEVKEMHQGVDWRSLYLYAVSLITLLVCLFTVINLINRGLDFIVPDQGYVDPYAAQNGSKVDPEVIRQANIDQNRRSAIRGITSSLVTLLVTVPVYLYHWKMVRKIAR